MAPQGSRVRAGLERAFCLFVLVALMAVMVPFAPPPAHAIVLVPHEYWVDNVNGDNTNPGTEAEPFETITYAITQANSADTIWVEPGTYSEANGETFNLVLDGETLRSTEGMGSTIIQGDGTKQLLVVNGWTAGDELVGFTFDNGGTGSGSAALHIFMAYATAPGWPRIAENTFSNNSAASGGAILLHSSAPGRYPLIEENIFTDNTAMFGGAIRATGDMEITVRNNTFEGNSAELGAGIAFETYAGTCTVEFNDFTGNTAAGPGGGGGAVYFYGSGAACVHSFSDNTITDGSASGFGGAVYIVNSRVDVERNLADGNAAPYGGFAYLQSADVRAENNYMTGHSATHSGSVWWMDSTSSLIERNDTLYAQASGVLVARAEPGTSLDVTNCIYWNPLVTAELSLATSVSYTCSRDSATKLADNGNTVGAGMVYADPAFDTGFGAPLLLETSPCVDSGDNADYPDIDFYYTDRPVDGNNDGTAVPDIGCVEYVPASVDIEDDAKGVYFGRLIRGVGAAYSGGSYVYGYSKAPYTGTRFETSFTGSKVRWIGPKQPNYGQAKVYLDGAYVTTVDCYAAPGDAAISATLWESAALTDGPHTLAIEMGSAKNAASSNYIVVIDKIEVDGAAPLGPVGVRENESAGTFIGGWMKNLTNTTYTYGTYAYSYWANARFVRNFYGTRVAWVGPKIYNYGRAAVYIDGVYKGTVSQYAPGADIGFRKKVWESAVLPAGNHTFEIRVLGTKDAASTGYFIVVDSIDVTP